MIKVLNLPIAHQLVWTIIDIQMIKKLEIDGDNQVELNLSGHLTGVYFIQVSNGQTIQYQRIVLK